MWYIIKSLQSALSTMCERCFEDLAKMAKAFSSIIGQSWMTLEDTLLYKSILNQGKFMKLR